MEYHGDRMGYEGFAHPTLDMKLPKFVGQPNFQTNPQIILLVKYQ